MPEALCFDPGSQRGDPSMRLTAEEVAALKASVSKGWNTTSDAFVLQIGADHSMPDAWGAAVWNDPGTLTSTFAGQMRVYLDHGISPYLAVCTSPDVTHSVANAANGLGATGWDKLRSMVTAGVEAVSHSHDHVQAWDGFSAAIQIGYGGSNGTATVAITSSTLTLSAGADSAAITLASYPTLAQLITAINAVSGWSALIPDATALTGAEATANLLPISGSRDAKTAGPNRFFCVGGGLAFSPPMTSTIISTVSPVEHFQVQLRNNGYIEVMVNGVRVAYINLAGGATFSSIVTALNAVTDLSQRGITAYLCDNGKTRAGGAGFRSYMYGDELTSVLTQAADYRPIQSGTFGGVLSAGLSQAYLRQRQYAQSVSVAAAQGVTLASFAEPGNYWYWRDEAGASPFVAHRGTPLISAINTEAVAYPQCVSGSNRQAWRSSFRFSAGYTTAAHLEAVADAMADSPGLGANILWHHLSDTYGDGAAAGYALGGPALGSDAEQDFRYAKAFLARVKQHIASGKIVSAGPAGAAALTAHARPPKNWLFNPRLRMGSAVAGAKTNDASSIPGWLLSASGAGVATSSVTRTADGALLLSSPDGITDFSLSQAIPFGPGERYKFGLDVPAAALAAGTGVQIGVRRGDVGRWEQRRVDVGQGQALEGSPIMTRAGHASGLLALRRAGTFFRPIRVVGLPGTYNITASNNQLQVALGLGSVAFAAPVSLTIGAARTARQVADEINAAIAADANMQATPEYCVPWARAEKLGRTTAALVLEFPECCDRVYVSGALISNSALVTLFGGAGGDRYMTYAAPYDSADIAYKGGVVAITASVQGTVQIRDPYVSRVETEL